MWEIPEASFPDLYVINHGFGGSQMSDLLFYLDDLVIRHRPAMVLIYEGDNDLAGGKAVREILADADSIVVRIKHRLPDCRVFLISAKPSIARWELREKYVRLNLALDEYCRSVPGVSFIDVWSPMINPDGQVRGDLFLPDGLHMNETGYAIWVETIGDALDLKY